MTPRVSVRWKMRKKISAGISETSAPAFVVGASIIRSPWSDARAMGIVWVSLVVSMTSGMKNSFHVQMKKKIMRTPSVGLTIG